MKIHDVEQGSEEWFALRAGTPTASEFKLIVSGTGQLSKSLPTYALKLAGEAFAGKPLDAWEGNQWTEQGNEREPLAVDEYELINEITVAKVGFVTKDGYGCSPDRITVDGKGLLEIKCLTAPKHIAAMLYIKKNDTIPPDYMSQVQGQMLTCESDWCDVMFFHPDLPSKIHRVFPDESFQTKLLSQLDVLIQERDNVLSFLEEQ